MIKVILPSSFDFEVPVVRLMDVHSRGVDRAWMQKRGAILTNEIGRIRPEPGHSYLHLIALGAMESYGTNRNGDSFNKQACEYNLPEPKKGVPVTIKLASGLLGHYQTFLQGHCFKHHQNKDPERKIGDVKEAAFNPDMNRVELIIRVPHNNEWNADLEKLANGKDIPFSMACFPPGALVKLSNSQEIPIEQVLVGATIVTHMGRHRHVEAVMHRPYCGDLVVMRAVGLIEPVKATPNHKIWVRPTLKGKAQICPVCSKAFRSLRAHLRQKPDVQHQLAYRDYGRYAENWCPAEQVATGDYVRTPFNRKTTSNGCQHLAVVLGYYLSEGNVFSYKRASVTDSSRGVDFSFNISETNLVENLCNELRQLGYSKIKTYNRKSNVTVVRVSSVKLYDEMLRLGGKYSWGKQIALEVMEWEPSVQLKLVDAFLDGDGHFSRSHPDLVGTTVSRTLAFQLAEMCWRNDVPARVNSYQSKQARKRRAYLVVIQGRFIDKFSTSKRPQSYQYKSSIRTISHLKHQRQGGTAIYVSSVVMAYVEKGFVYRRVTRVSREFYDGPVFNLTVADDHSYVINGVAVSNCKVAYDICSICGNRASNRGEYCDHLSNHMTEITKTGHQVTAINDVPNFFDISKVIRPADRIAWSLQKVAAIDCLTEPVGGARLAEMLGVSAPDAVLYQGSPAIAQKVASARKLAAIEKLIEGVARGEDNAHVRKLMSGCPHEQVPADDMEKLRSVQLGTALQGLASAQICLSVRDFLRLVAGDESASGGADMVEDALPGMYNRLLQNGGIEECAADSAYDPADTAIPRQIKEVLGKLAGGHSLADGPLQGRVHVTIIKGFMPGLPKRASYDSVAVSPEIQKVAKEYAKYQLSFLEAVGTNPLSTGLTVVRNYIRVC
jgi:hypothetical protein